MWHVSNPHCFDRVCPGIRYRAASRQPRRCAKKDSIHRPGRAEVRAAFRGSCDSKSERVGFNAGDTTHSYRSSHTSREYCNSVSRKWFRTRAVAQLCARGQLILVGIANPRLSIPIAGERAFHKVAAADNMREASAAPARMPRSVELSVFVIEIRRCLNWRARSEPWLVLPPSYEVQK